MSVQHTPVILTGNKRNNADSPETPQNSPSTSQENKLEQQGGGEGGGGTTGGREEGAGGGGEVPGAHSLDGLGRPEERGQPPAGDQTPTYPPLPKIDMAGRPDQDQYEDEDGGWSFSAGKAKSGKEDVSTSETGRQGDKETGRATRDFDWADGKVLSVY